MDPSALDGAARGHQRLSGDLPSEHPLAVLVGTHASEDVDFDRFEIEELHEKVERVAHQAILKWPARRGVCSLPCRLVTTQLSRGVHVGDGNGRSPDRGWQRQQRLVGLRAHTGLRLRRAERRRVRQLAPLAGGSRPGRPAWVSARTGSRSSGAGSSPKKTSGRLRASTTTGGW